MRAKLHYIIITFSLVLITTGCGTTHFSVVKNEIKDFPDCSSAVAMGRDKKPLIDTQGKQLTVATGTGKEAKLNPEYISEVINANATFEPFLNCFFGTNVPAIGETGANNAAEARLYRGYLILALYSTYGAFNYELDDYQERAGDAAGLLSRIEEAHIRLVSASSIADKIEDTLAHNKDLDEYIPRVQRLSRIIQVMEVGVQAGRPTIARLKKRFSLFNSLGFSSGGLNELAKVGLLGIYKKVNLGHYGKAYMSDMRDHMHVLSKNNWKIEEKYWFSANKIITRACDRLIKVAEVSRHSCTLKKKTGV